VIADPRAGERLQDTIGDTLLPAWLAAHGE
jgi:hypothetical protein